MVFSSIPAYLDPANWQQQVPNYQTGSSGTNLLPPPIPPAQPHGAGGAGSIRPGSMADRARMANVAMPETAQKCPRCESTSTKFCYFNNYSLSQPRHFCKTCRRYWTRGGALRNVPVGGGCRRNKRNGKGSSSSTGSSSRSKSPANSETASGSTSSTLPSHSSGTAGVSNSILGGLQTPHLRFPSPLGHLTDYATSGHHEFELNYGGLSAPVVATSEMNFQIGSLFGGTGGYGGGVGVASLLSSGAVEQWRPQLLQQQQHFPNFLGGFDPTISQGGLIYPPNYQGTEGVEGSGGYVGAKLSNASMLSQLASVKMEGSHNNNSTNNNINNQDHQSNLARQFLGSVQGNENKWSTTTGNNAWTDLSGFNSSSTSNAL